MEEAAMRETEEEAGVIGVVGVSICKSIIASELLNVSVTASFLKTNQVICC
jgi:8-oxo-dGTP pyrophosphatase MutT (NUDIX family)